MSQQIPCLGKQLLFNYSRIPGVMKKRRVQTHRSWFLLVFQAVPGKSTQTGYNSFSSSQLQQGMLFHIYKRCALVNMNEWMNEWICSVWSSVSDCSSLFFVAKMIRCLLQCLLHIIAFYSFHCFHSHHSLVAFSHHCLFFHWNWTLSLFQ